MVCEQMKGNKTMDNLTVSYAKLWKLLIDRKIKKPEFKEIADIAPSTYAKLNRDQFVSMKVIARICGVLSVDVGDVMEFVSDGSPSEEPPIILKFDETSLKES